MQFLFPNEILQLILNFLSTRDLFRLKLTNRQFRQVIEQIKSAQLSQVQLSFPDDHRKQFAHICKSANYLLFNHYLHIFKDNKSRDFWLPFLNISCLSGDYHIPNHLIKKYQNNQKLENPGRLLGPFSHACQGGNIKLVKKLIKLGVVGWNCGLRGACHSGHIKIVKLMIKNGADDWTGGLYNVCHSGHMKIVKLIIENLERSAIIPNWNWGLHIACQNKHTEIIKLMIEKGADFCHHCYESISEHV